MYCKHKRILLSKLCKYLVNSIKYSKQNLRIEIEIIIRIETERDILDGLVLFCRKYFSQM